MTFRVSRPGCRPADLDDLLEAGAVIDIRVGNKTVQIQVKQDDLHLTVDTKTEPCLHAVEDA